MKKIVLSILMATTFMYAGAKHIEATPKVVQSGIKIIDIRTKPEWIQTGIVKNSIPITFFDLQGKYDAKAFLGLLSKYVTKNEEFAIICRTGNRTTAVSQFLAQVGYNVINLKGGVTSLMRQGYKLSKYSP